MFSTAGRKFWSTTTGEQAKPRATVGGRGSGHGEAARLLPPQASFVEFSRPVENDGHGRSLALLHWCVDQKALAVASYIIYEEVRIHNRLARSGLKHGNWHA